jgi:high-affinity Fe2+/Pb2+ permease
MNTEQFNELKDLFTRYSELETKLNKTRSANYRQNYEATMCMIEMDIATILMEFKRESYTSRGMYDRSKTKEKRKQSADINTQQEVVKSEAQAKDSSILDKPAVVTASYQKHLDATKK